MYVETFYLTLQVLEPKDPKWQESINKMIPATREPDPTTQARNDGELTSAMRDNEIMDDNVRCGVGRINGSSVLCGGDENGRIELLVDLEGNMATNNVGATSVQRGEYEKGSCASINSRKIATCTNGTEQNSSAGGKNIRVGTWRTLKTQNAS